MPVVSEFAGNSLPKSKYIYLLFVIALSFDWTKRFFSRVKKLLRFSDWPMCVTKRVFHMGKIYSKNSVSI